MLGGLGTVPQVLAPGSFVQQVGDPRIFFVDGTGALRYVQNQYTFTAMGGNWQTIIQIPSLDGYPMGASMPVINPPTPAQVAAAAAPASTGDWFTDPAQELISGVPNMYIVGGAAVLVLLLMIKKK